MTSKADPRFRQQVGTGTAAVGVANQRVLVLAVDFPTQMAFVTSSLNQQMNISMTRLPGKGSLYPAPGETWMITSLFGSWMFMFPIIPEASSGDTDSRSANPQLGQPYFDTTIGRPVWYNGTEWVDATGASV
jgi:hypothetical protein